MTIVSFADAVVALTGIEISAMVDRISPDKDVDNGALLATCIAMPVHDDAAVCTIFASRLHCGR